MEGFIGEIREFGGNFAPRNWASCDGQTISIKTYTALYAVIGTTYGGDGINNFQLPDLRPTDSHGTKVHGWEIGQPSKIICIDGYFPDRS
jgi:microcystin-dependent protein